MSPEIIHSLVLILTIGISFLIAKSPLGQYDLQITAALFILLFLARRLIVNKNFTYLMESVVFAIVVMMIVLTTGSVDSPFFFLVYFLLFSLSLLLEPLISISTTITLVVLFLFSLPPNQDLKTLIPIFSLAFLTPFALFMGKEYQESQKLKVKSQKLETDSLLFLSLMLKNHLKSIKVATENFLGDHELTQIKKHTRTMEKLIEHYEKNN